MTLGNGLGGFADQARAYAIVLEGPKDTPMPWVNVIANPRFGTIVTAAGSAHTWSGNSRENRLTPFANDPVSDPTAEAIFIRDDETGGAWTPTPGPMARDLDRPVDRPPQRGPDPLRRASTHGIDHELDIFVDACDPVKVSLLTLHNPGPAPRTLSLFAYNEWVLGPPRDGEQRHVVTERDPATGAIFATNPYNHEFSRHVAFAAASEPVVSVTAERRSFLGRNGDISHPAALRQATLSGQLGRGPRPLRRPACRRACWNRANAGRSSSCWARAPTATTRAR